MRLAPGAPAGRRVAAVLYGIGARLDKEPELLFSLRRVDAQELVHHVQASPAPSPQRTAPGKVLDDALPADIFGIEMADVYTPKKPLAGKKIAAGKTAKKLPARPGKSATGKVVAPAPKATNPPATPNARTVAAKRSRVRSAKNKPG